MKSFKEKVTDYILDNYGIDGIAQLPSEIIDQTLNEVEKRIEGRLKEKEINKLLCRKDIQQIFKEIKNGE